MFETVHEALPDTPKIVFVNKLERGRAEARP